MRVSHDSSDGWQEISPGVELPSRFEMTWPAVRGAPRVVMRFEVAEGVPQCVEVNFRNPEGGRGVRTADLRFAKIDDWIEVCSGLLARHVVDVTEDGQKVALSTTRDRDFREATSAVTRARSGSRRRITAALLKEVSEVYREHVEATPTAEVAAHFEVSRRTAGDYVRQARDRGYLGASIKGKAGEQ